MSSYREHNELVNKVLLYLSEHCPGRYWSNATGAVKTANGHFQRYGLIGSTDILGFTKDGRFVAVEVKTGKAVLSQQQKIFKEVAEKHKVFHRVVYNEINEGDFDEIR
jgi:predicted Mrr-cat superfamily restriction endonuclease